MNVLMFSPGFPYEQPFFTRGLRRQGANVVGVGDQPAHDLPPMARESLADYWQIGSFSDEGQVLEQIVDRARHVRIDQVESTWEPLMTLAAKLRARLGLAGMTLEETIPFRDKEVMKRVLDRHGIRTPRHASTTSADGVRQAAAAIGYPICVKPIAGAGSADTFRVENERELENVLPQLRHVPEVSVEEFIEGEEYTFDTICIDGEIRYYNISWYRPNPLVQRQHQWISPQTMALRNPDVPQLAGGRALGVAVLKALGFRTGFTHMEWFRKPDGEAVFGEIAARPPGASSVDIMNFANDVDLYEGWAEAVLHRRFSLPLEREVQRGAHLQAGAGGGADPADHRAGEFTRRVRSAPLRDRPAADRCTPAQLEADSPLRWNGDHPPSGPRHRL